MLSARLHYEKGFSYLTDEETLQMQCSTAIVAIGKIMSTLLRTQASSWGVSSESATTLLQTQSKTSQVWCTIGSSPVRVHRHNVWRISAHSANGNWPTVRQHRCWTLWKYEDYCSKTHNGARTYTYTHARASGNRLGATYADPLLLGCQKRIQTSWNGYSQVEIIHPDKGQAKNKNKQTLTW